jgi:hypothetical protein
MLTCSNSSIIILWSLEARAGRPVVREAVNRKGSTTIDSLPSRLDSQTLSDACGPAKGRIRAHASSSSCKPQQPPRSAPRRRRPDRVLSSHARSVRHHRAAAAAAAAERQRRGSVAVVNSSKLLSDFIRK